MNKKYLLSYSLLNNKEFNQLFSLAYDTANQNNPEKNNILNEHSSLEKMSQRLQKALNKEQASLLTEKLEAEDKLRDAIYSGFMSWCSSYLNFKDAAKQDAAKVLDNYFSSLGTGIASLNFQAETSILSKMTAELKSNSTYSSALNTLGSDGAIWLTDLENANNSFDATYLQRSTDLGLSATDDTFIKLRPQAIAIIEDYYDSLKSIAKVNNKTQKDNTDINKALAGMDGVIEQYKQLIKQTKAQKKEEAKK